MRIGQHSVWLVLFHVLLVGCRAPTDQQPAQAAPPPVAAAPAPDPEALAAAAAIERVKRSHALKYVNYNLPPGAISRGGGDPAKTDTEHAISNELRHMKGDLRVVGWEASKFDDQHYVVTYCWTLNGNSRCFPFEVNTVGDLVRHIGDDRTLLKKYGFGRQ